MDGARPDALSDAQLDRDLETALGVEPSPEFLARVRTRVASEPQAFVESGFSRMLRRAVEPMWAVAIAGIVLAFVVPQLMRDEATPSRPSASPVAGNTPAAGPDLPARPVPVPQMASSSTRPAPRAEAEWGRTVPLQLSPVLFAEEDRWAFALFVAAAGEGRLPEEAVRPADESGELEELAIRPLVIEPLATLARTAREGEEQWD